jgi:hypothetical protein
MRASMSTSISGPAAAPGRRLDLEAVVGPGVVAGGDDDAGRGLPLDDLERGHLRRHGPGAKAIGMSWARTTSAAAAAKCSLAKRRS